MPPNLDGLLARLLVGLALGLLIGMERGWERRDAPEGHRMAGFRTFGLIGLLGGVCALPIPGMPSWLAPIMLVGLSLSVAVGYWRSSAAGDDISMTSAITALLTFALGGIAGTGELTVAAASAVVVTILLGKPELHALLRKIDRNELEATFRLLLISVVVLPVLPNQTFGPWHALNPYRIWWMVVLVAGISYIGYFAARIIGPRAGVLAAARFGDISSSTAVSVELSREAKDKPAARNLFAAGIIAVSGMMFPRILAIVAIVASGLASPLAGPVAAAGLVSFAFAAATWWIHRDSAPDREASAGSRNPLDLRIAIEFGVFFGFIMLVSQGARQLAGASGLYVVGAIDGLVDVDAITLSVATLWVRGELDPSVAVGAIAIAAAANTVVKTGIAAVLGGVRLAVWVGVPMLAALAAGAAMIFWRML